MSQANFAPYMECSLNIAVDLVNTGNEDHEHLETATALTEFLKDHGLSNFNRATLADLEEVRRVRATLRNVFRGDRQEAVDALNSLLIGSDARPMLTDHDGEPWHLHYTPIDGPLATRIAAECAMALSVVIAESGFERLRTCDSETCGDVFVDESRNRSRLYCSPSICGNRASVRAYRERQKSLN